MATQSATQLVSGNIPNLNNGVSQQPFPLRLASQAKECVNGWPTVAEGLKKRPPTKFVAKLLASVPDTANIHVIERGDAERYIVVMMPGQLPQVFDFDGIPRTVAAPNGIGYMSAGGKFEATTVADYTFILNTAMVPQLSAALGPGQYPSALVWIKAGNYLTSYTIVIDGVHSFTYTTHQTEPATINTAHIAGQLVSQINAHGHIQAWQIGSVIHLIRSNAGYPQFTVRTEDTMGNSAMGVIKDRVNSAADLPKYATSGFEVEITGMQGNAHDNYYVRFTQTAGSDDNALGGVWQECAKPYRQTSLNPATMPHMLVREANGTFTFKQAPWVDCRAGDETTNPTPSFVGKKVNDIFFYKNRLGMIADESVILSKTGEYFNYWRDTATTLLDTDPIDITVAHVKVSILKYAIPFNEALLLFADKTQFELKGEGILSPNTVSVSQMTEFETANTVRPVGAGRYVFFSTKKGNYAGLREYFVVDGQSQANDANDVTSHVPSYIKGDVTIMSGSTNEDCVVCVTEEEPNTIYLYKYYWIGQEKVQSSWTKWTFDSNVTFIDLAFNKSTLWIVSRRDDGSLTLSRLDLAWGETEMHLDYIVHLDEQFTKTTPGIVRTVNTDSKGIKTTTITIPTPLDDLQVVALQGDATYKTGSPIPAATPYNPATRTIILKGEVTEWLAGAPYSLKYTFSPLMMRKAAPQGGLVAVTSGRTQLRRMSLNFADTGYFRAEVTAQGRDTYTNVFTGRILGSINNRIGVPAIETGTYRFPIMGNNMNLDIKLINDTPFPSTFLNADWEALYTVRSVDVG